MKIFLFIGALACVILGGCTKEEELILPSPSNAGDPLATSGGINPVQMAPTPPAEPVSFSSTDRPVNASGKALTDLEYLNQLLAEYNEARFNFTPESTPYKTDEERQAHELAMEQALKKLREPILDLNELVKGGIIKAIPEAPIGQKYAINPNSRRVELVTQ